MKGMCRATVHCSLGRDQGLSNDLPPKDALPAHLRTQTAIEIAFERFQIEDRYEFINRGAHGSGLFLCVFWVSNPAKPLAGPSQYRKTATIGRFERMGA